MTFAEPSLIQYRTFDGRQIPAFVYRPARRASFPGRRPVLIEIHGGPESQFRPGFLGRLNYLINELGIVLIMPNVRGSSGYGKTYLKLDNGMLREGAREGHRGTLRLDRPAARSRQGPRRRDRRFVRRLHVAGGPDQRTTIGSRRASTSSGSRTSSRSSRTPRATAATSGAPSTATSAIRRCATFLERISPLASAGKIRTPILIVQGQNDPRVPLSEAEQVVSAVRKNGVPVWYVVGKNEGHGFARKINQDYLQAVEVLFLRRFLLGKGNQSGSPVPF